MSFLARFSSVNSISLIWQEWGRYTSSGKRSRWLRAVTNPWCPFFILCLRAPVVQSYNAGLMISRSTDRSCTRGMIHNTILLISSCCPRRSIALQCRIVALKTIHFMFIPCLNWNFEGGIGWVPYHATSATLNKATGLIFRLLLALSYRYNFFFKSSALKNVLIFAFHFWRFLTNYSVHKFSWPFTGCTFCPFGLAHFFWMR